MRNTLDEKRLLQSIQQSYEIREINNTSHDIKYIIKNMNAMEPEPPDFICGNDVYIEHFEVSAYKRVENKTGKLFSVHLADEAQMEKRASRTQNVFNTTHFHTPDNRTNTRYLKENIDTLISEKTLKQEEYDRKCPNAKQRHLLIELTTSCEILLGSNGQYLDGSETESERLEAPSELYEIYRDSNFIKLLKEKYSDTWDLLIFVEEFRHRDIHTFYLYCFDLKEDIILENMKNYPEKLSQIALGEMHSLQMSGEVEVTNIRYTIEPDNSDFRSFLWSYSADTIIVNEIPLYKSNYDSIYMTKDKGFQFETSQLAFAINPDVNVDIMLQYIPLLLKEVLSLDCQGTSIELKRETFIGTYFSRNGTNALFKIDSKRCLPLKLLPQ